MFSDPPGSFEICSICNWEDDPLQLRVPTLAGGANTLSLFEAQTRYFERTPLTSKGPEQLRRAKAWRRLQIDDLPTKECSTPSDGYARYYWETTTHTSDGTAQTEPSDQ